MWTKEVVDEILDHINEMRISMAEMTHSVIRIRETLQQMSEAFESMTKQVAVAIGDVYVEAPSICPDLNEDHYG